MKLFLKKLVSSALCAALLCSGGSFGFANEQEKNKCSIEQTDLSELTVKVSSDKERLSVMVFPKGKTYKDLHGAPEWSADIVVFAKEFKNSGTTEFKMDLSNTRSGEYTLYLSENGDVSQYDFKFVRGDIKGDVYKSINASASKDDIAEVLDYAHLDLGISDEEWSYADKEGISEKLWTIKQGGFVFGENDNGKSDIYLYSAIVIDLLNKSKLNNIFEFTEKLNMANTEFKNWCKNSSVTEKTKTDVTKRLSARAIKDYEDFLNKFKDSLILGVVGGSDNYMPVKKVIGEFADYIGIDSSKLNDSAYTAVQGVSFDSVAELTKALKDRYNVTGGGSSSGGGGGASGGRTNTIKTDNIAETVVPEKMPTDIFVDLDSVSWAREAIVALAEKRVICGKEDKMFYPNDTVTRYEFAKIVSNAFLSGNADEKDIPFIDVSKDLWAYEYVKTAYSNGVITGKQDNLFDGDSFITRQEMAAILYRAAQKAEKSLSDYENAKDYRFNDDDLIDEFAKEPIYVLHRDGVINGVGDDLFAPRDRATRAEAAQMVYLAMSL